MTEQVYQLRRTCAGFDGHWGGSRYILDDGVSGHCPAIRGLFLGNRPLRFIIGGPSLGR
jgi:hypothetical protein